MKSQAIQPPYFQPLTRRKLAIAARAPALALRPDVAFAVLPAQDDSFAADQFLGPADSFAPLCAPKISYKQDQKCDTNRCGAGDDAIRDAISRNIGVDEHRRADDESGDASEAENAEGRHKSFGDHEDDAKHEQRKSGIIERKLAKGV